MKKLILSAGILTSAAVYSQVGIDTETPKATLQVMAKASDLTKADGIIAPRLTGSELQAKDAAYGTNQNAALVYVTSPLDSSEVSPKTANVTSTGYFYFDGNIWQKLSAGNTGTDWSLLGNSGTLPGTNFIGTTDAQDFIVKTDNTERERTYNAPNTQNFIKKITGGDLSINGITVGRGSGNRNSNATVGYQSLNANDTGGNNVAMGSFALYNNTTGFSNVAVGHSSMTGNTEGGSNVAIGQSTLPFNTTGELNIAIGHSALSNSLNKTGRHNIGIGFTAGGNLEDATSNNIAIGSFQGLANRTGSNQLNIGGAIFGTGLTGTQAAPTGNIGIGISEPNAYSRLQISSGNQGILIPSINLTSPTMDLDSDGDNDASNQPEGLIVFNNGTTLNAGFYFWNGNEWRALTDSSAVAPSINTLLCTNTSLSPSSWSIGNSYSGNLKVSYTGGNGGSYQPGNPFVVNGLTFTLRSGKLEYGNGELTFSVSGIPTSNSDMTIPFSSSEIPFLTSAQSCSATVSNQTNADIKNVAAVGYPLLTTDANGATGYTFQLGTPDGNYRVRVRWNTTNGLNGARPHVQLYNNTGSSKTLYWNYETIYGGNISNAGRLPVPNGFWGGDQDSAGIWTTQTLSNNAYWGNEGIYDGANLGPEYRRYTWIDNSLTTKVTYTAYIMAGSSSNSSSPTPDSTKVYIKIEQVTAP